MQYKHLAQRFVETVSGSPEERQAAEQLLRWVLGPLAQYPEPARSDEEIETQLDDLMTVGNKTAASGCDRCTCGCKYWENDTCIDCGTKHDPELFKERVG